MIITTSGHSMWSRVPWPLYYVGEIVEVYYDLKNPKNAIANTFIERHLAPCVVLFFGTVLIWTSIRGVYKPGAFLYPEQ